ncbi:MAG: ATP-binding cassette domain-containing protein, partial [Clostridium sp.]
MIKLEHVSKTFDTGSGNVDAVKDVNLEIEDGKIFGIIGFSGAGKSTLVRCINLLERPTTGSVVMDDIDLMSLD